MADIAIERFEVVVSSNGQTHTLTNDVGSLSNAFVRLVGSSDKSSGGPTNTTGNSGPNNTGCGVLLTDTSELTFYIPNTTPRRIMGEVWRYTGSPGGDYEFISRQRGNITINSGGTNSTSVSGVSDRNKVIPFYTGFTNSQSSQSNWEYAVYACHIDSSSNIVFSKNNTNTQAHTAYYDAVEFTGSAWSVGHAINSSHDTGNNFFNSGQIVTMNTDSTGSGGSTFDVSNWSTATVIEGTMEADTAETGLSDCLMYFGPGNSTTTVRMTLDNSNSRNDGTAYCHVLQCDDLIVNRATNNNIPEGNGNYGTPLSMPAGVNASTDLSELSLEWFSGTNGEGTAHSRGRLIAQIIDNSGYQIQHWVHRSGNNTKAAYGVVDLSGLVSTQSYTLTADPGVFTNTGQNVSLLKASRLNAEAQSFSLSGDADLRKDYRVTVDSGVYTLTGQDVTLSVITSTTLNVDPGVFNVSGSVTLRKDSRLSAESSTISISGDADLRKDFLLSALPGVFNITGLSVDLGIFRDIVMIAEAGSFSVQW